MFPILGDMSAMMGLLSQREFETTDLWLEHLYELGVMYGKIARQVVDLPFALDQLQ
eukprot:CAMPEP_0176347420 /NCGR_PEP_ID=MMETSP0126-20121128/7039_1 /TAXON_ID=141414 ORGANISM="Strombidinopsis acuminatum, Strain SPMC142" /NCGR_SAMPLE_ID=MMETSP0126 /ASSEMBLY_ACC=CAM_ASM_000229 /LENGTH=55 /DNA_ID=CAMNT_0017695577 /DNA_START=595 /DNA_END=762 /DNA_ORIENTATION=+